MFCIENNEKNKSAVILNPERSEWVSRSHVTSVESVVNDGAKTQCYSAKRDLYGPSLRSTLKMTLIAFIFTLVTTTESSAGTWDCGESENTVSCSLDENGVFTISGTGKMKDYMVNANGYYNSPWGSANIQTVVVDKGVTSIGDFAFYYAKSLTRITIPDSVTRIGNNAFESAKSLTSITIPKGVTSIGDYAFRFASSLESITIPDSVTRIGDSAFRNATGLTSITIPDSVTSIGEYAFYGTSNLKSITIPDSVTSIGESAFQWARSLTSITIPDSVKSIGDRAFLWSTSLTNIMCKGDEASCTDTITALKEQGVGDSVNISYPTNQTSCEGSDISMYVWDSINRKCGRRNEKQCNSVAKYYYSDGKCQVLPKTKSACTGTNIEWNATDNKCVNKNYTPSQEADNGNTGGDVSGDFNPADCYNKGQVPYNNQCWDEYPFAKKRWTPAEANEWLHDGNDNFVVITFKK